MIDIVTNLIKNSKQDKIQYGRIATTHEPSRTADCHCTQPNSPQRSDQNAQTHTFGFDQHEQGKRGMP